MRIYIVTTTCGECGIHFGLTTAMYDDLRKSGRTFYCPNGHGRYFPQGKSVAQKSRKAAKGEAS